MNSIDTSDYEDKLMILINNYEKSKDTLKYSIYNNSVNIYGLVDKRILNVDNPKTVAIGINLIDHAKEVTMYKKYLTDKSIFDDDTLGVKNTIIFTESTINETTVSKISSGKIQANIFVEEFLYGTFDADPMDVAKAYIRKLSDEQKSNLINQTSNNKGSIFQRAYRITHDIENDYYIVNAVSYQALCSVAYFNDEAFLDYIKLKTSLKKDNDMTGFEEYMKDYFPKLEILPTRTEDYYISSTGELLGRTKEEVDEKRRLEAEEQERLLQEQLQNEQNQQPEENPNETNEPTPTPTQTPTPTPTPTQAPTPSTSPTPRPSTTLPPSPTSSDIQDSSSRVNYGEYVTLI